MVSPEFKSTSVPLSMATFATRIEIGPWNGRIEETREIYRF